MHGQGEVEEDRQRPDQRELGSEKQKMIVIYELLSSFKGNLLNFVNRNSNKKEIIGSGNYNRTPLSEMAGNHKSWQAGIEKFK